MFSGSLMENRISVGLPPPLRQDLTEEARRLSLTVPDVIRYILLAWHLERAPRK